MDSWSLAAIAVIIVAYAGLSRRLQGSPVSAAMFFLAAGLVAGNEVLDLVDFGVSSEQVRLLAEATLTLVLFSDASRIDLGRLRGEVALPARLLGIGLPLTIVVGAALAGRRDPRPRVGRGRDPRDHARAHRRGARAGRGLRSAHARRGSARGSTSRAA